MKDGIGVKQTDNIELEYDLQETPQKVWRAISIPEFRENWLPQEVLVDSEAAFVTSGQEVTYKMRDTAFPFLESFVTFRITPNDTGGTNLRIVHKLADKRFVQMMSASANSNTPISMLAA
jgi:uncharacterized protein YndB with AHSA1/START domain